MYLWWMLFLAISTGIMGTGDSYMIWVPKTQGSHRSLTVGAVCCPRQNEKVMERVLQDENEMNARIFQFPTSAVKEKGRKIHYYDFFMEGQYDECNKALLRIVPKIRMDMILDFLENVPYLSNLQRTFYQTYIQARSEKTSSARL